MSTLKVLIDTEQRRVKRERISATVAGAEWDGPLWSDTWIAPVCDTVMLRPAPLYPAWHTSSSGVNARLGLSDFGLTADPSGSGWQAFANKAAGATRMQKGDVMTATVSTTAIFGKNRGWFVSFFDFGVGNDDKAVRIEFGISNTGDGTAGISFRYWSGGKIDVYQDGHFIESGTLGNKNGTQTANQYQDLLIIPMRKKEILIYSITGGDAFVVVLDSIPETETAPVIFADQKFWFLVPSPGKVDVEIAPLKFATTGYATSLEIALSKPVPSGLALEAWANGAIASTVTTGRVIGDTAYEGTAGASSCSVTALSFVKLDGSAFVPDGVLTGGRMKVSLAGPGTHTPFVYVGHMAYEAEFANTDGTHAFDLTPYILEASLSVPDEGGGMATFTCTLKDPNDIATHVAGFLNSENRAAQVLIGEQIIMDGLTMPVKFVDAEHDEVMRANLEIRDRMHQLQGAMFRERFPLSGMDLCRTPGAGANQSIVEFIYKQRGLDTFDFSDVAYTIPVTPGKSATDLPTQIDVGAKMYDELSRAQSTYASTFIWGLKPTPTGIVATFLDPDDLPTTPDVTIYRSAEDAIADGVDAAAADTKVAWSYNQQPLPIEANEFRAQGVDPRTNRVIQSYAVDEDSQDPTVVPASRADNWLGEPRVMGVQDPRILTQADADRVVVYTFPQVSARYWICETECEFQWKADGSPLWRGDMLKVDGHRTFRVSSLRMQFVREYDGSQDDAGEIICRPTTYTGGTITNAGGVGLEAIRMNFERRAVEKTVRRGPWEMIAGRTPFSGELVVI